ncbi:hypothetical protein BCR43DRAFT_492323 [Syncephalastrum racemosum]|uniref:HTH TFE/IIEalpha-type domain-containing protein n=1 Tax=Syncephalastrum racemosum TaxID=13706 RepID=A0A1X2HDG0_SYNRA|nr:hypothetical protein BCR43DRAFT_492323 [Syncephalastrum racemosum]
MEVLKTLVARVARAFYDPKYIVILDELNKTTPNMNGIREEDLVMALKMTPRDVHRNCGKLKEDRLLKMATRQEARKQDQRAVPKNYYYIDYKEFVDVVKWKMYQMQLRVRKQLKKESENKGYICPTCQRSYDTMEVLSLLKDGMFHCEVCNTILEENNNTVNLQESQEELQKLREQSQPIIHLLKQTDTIVIPANYTFKPSANRNGAGDRDDHELAIAQDTGAGQGDIIVDLQKDNEAAMRAKQAEAEEKRQQNMLPVWHQRSTVSDSLRGTGDRPDEPAAVLHEEEDTFEEVGVEEFDEDRDDYYAKYYESYESAQPGMHTGFEEDLEEEEFETVTNENGKRGRSPDDEDGGSPKHARHDSEEEDVPLVSVNGKMMPLNEVAEEDQRNMTTDEYKAYYEAWQKWQME